MECNFKIERDPHVKGYTMISNASNGKVLSLAAKGLLKELLSLPSDWHLSIGGLAMVLKDGKDAISSALKELEDNGYITRQKQFSIDKCGRRVFAGCFYTIYENPYTEKSYTENPHTGNPCTGNPCTENGGDIIINNKEINKDNKDLDNNNKDYKPLTPSDEGVTFEQFWDAYGVKKSKKDAERAWKKLSKADKDAAMKAIPAYQQDCVRCDRHRQYAATYLNKRTFEDDFSFNDNKPNNNGRTNNGLAGETPQTNADRAAEWATNRIKEVLENAKRKNQGGVQGEIPDGGSSYGGFLPF